MECPYGQSSTTTERPETTVRRYRRFRCRACEQGFSGRTSSVSGSAILVMLCPEYRAQKLCLSNLLWTHSRLPALLA